MRGIFLSIYYILILFAITIPGSAKAQESDMPHGDNFNLDCDLCHSTVTWQINPGKSAFKHEDTGFSLIGEHGFIDCRSCHESLIFNQIGHACIDCHTDIHKGELGIHCDQCHTPTSWDSRQDVFILHEASRFPLIGIHAILDCQSCHTTEQYQEYKMTAVECRGCHLENYMQSENPAHKKAQFELNCEQCHLPNSSNWQNTIYQHTPSFPLNGGHSQPQCNDCHTQTFAGTNTDCYFCHRTDYEQTVDPAHATFRFPTICQTCHDIFSWSASSFDHLVQSGFALNGAHFEIYCTDCHVNNQLTGLSRDCYDCHQIRFAETTNPNHVENNFPHDCLLCHNETSFSPAEFDHNNTGFPLTGAHAATNCEDCHQAGQYTGLASDCYSCHDQEYNNVSDPSHVTNNFDKDCSICHNTSDWGEANFDHALTNFPLTGAHASINCIDCHTNGQFSGLDKDCYSCHEQDYNGVGDPNHISNNFDKDCSICHNTSDWGEANFDHALTSFPLEDKHSTVDCSSCHSAGYTGISIECISCHESEYAATSNPSHAAVQFPVTCENCHDAKSWDQANWDHDAQYFPIYSGKHQGEWDNCADCHVNASDYTLFECIYCHEHSNKSEVDQHHSGEPGYTYESTACKGCHPNGRVEDGGD